MPHYFYIHNISLDDFSAIQTARGGIYIFTTGTLYKISSRALLPPSLRTGIFTVKCACPESFRALRNTPFLGTNVNHRWAGREDNPRAHHVHHALGPLTRLWHFRGAPILVTLLANSKDTPLLVSNHTDVSWWCCCLRRRRRGPLPSHLWNNLLSLGLYDCRCLDQGNLLPPLQIRKDQTI